MTPRTNGALAALATVALGLLGSLAAAAPAHADSDRAYVEGTLTDAAGRPFGAVTVALGTRKPGGSMRYHRQLTAKTDPTGHYVLDLERSKLHSGWKLQPPDNPAGAQTNPAARL